MRCERATVAEAFCRFVVLMCLATALAPENSRAGTQLIALSGDLQPGGLAQLSGVSQATLNDAGEVAFGATLAHGIGGVSSLNDRAVWKVSAQQRQLLAWGGVSTAAGGGVHDQFQSVSIDDAWNVVVRGTTATAAQRIWRFTSGGGSQVVASTGAPTVPGVPESALGSLAAPHLHNAAGPVAYNALLAFDSSVSSDNDRGVWLDDGTGTLLAREQVTPPPGVPGGEYTIPLAHAVNADGEVALVGSLKQGAGGVASENALGLWRLGADGGALVARRNAEGVPELAGASFAAFQDPTINSSGSVAFTAQLSAGGAITATNDRGVWLVEETTGHLLAQSGSAAPGIPGALFAQFGDPLLNDADEALVEGSLIVGVGGVSAGNAVGLWRLESGGGSLVARAGSVGVPGAPAASFADFGSLAFNAAGAAAVHATLSAGAGGINSSNDEGIWLFTPTGGVLVAREGDALAGRVVEDLEFLGGSGGSDGRQRSLNDSSQLLFKAAFTNGDEGLFLFTPEGDSTNVADFTLDGRVDGLDLARWRSHVGASSGAARADGDADGDADVDGADFLAWQREVGFGVPIAAVPEPPAALLFPVGLLLGLVLRRGP